MNKIKGIVETKVLLLMTLIFLVVFLCFM